ncbi:Prp18-domain-containing protein [Rozella allomycis CSF55]|uniref:Pre-mRNA-splicing factor 18 n=1 Tax=Rozella allomycis (strain CSF55) TaxID=988480 RepID=A0A4P9YK76_ROZAC|nr:Prp18-domain-containing protein [Rozella allomycis CSF55]
MSSLKDTLQAEIEKKRKLLQTVAPDKKYVKLSELEKLREKDSQKKRPVQNLHDEQVETEEDGIQIQIPKSTLKEEEIISRLRELDEPIRLFGETDFDRLKRLEERENSSHKSSRELKNLIEKHALVENERDQTEEEQNKLDKMKKELDSLIFMTNNSNVDLAELMTEETTKLRFACSLYCKRLLLEWKYDLERMPEEEKESKDGKHKFFVYKQAEEYIAPFFERMRDNKLAKDVLSNIAQIFYSLKEKDYVKANDAYLLLSLGNAAWPMGVMGPINLNERHARDLIETHQIAHVLNDEAQRKWIQTIKRLITYAENKYPSDYVPKTLFIPK